MTKAEAIYSKLIEQNIKNASGNVTLSLLGVSFSVREKSAFGDLLQEWFMNWLQNNNIFYRTNHNSQEAPDFFLSEADDKDLLEIKTFDYTKTPNFDLANFDTYVRDLQTKPYKLDSDYIILAYEIEGGNFVIKDVWLKKIWEMTAPSPKYPLRLQVKQEKIYNIRPVRWYSDRMENQVFKSKEDFLSAINAVIQSYPYTSSDININDWLDRASSGN